MPCGARRVESSAELPECVVAFARRFLFALLETGLRLRPSRRTCGSVPAPMWLGPGDTHGGHLDVQAEAHGDAPVAKAKKGKRQNAAQKDEEALLARHEQAA